MWRLKRQQHVCGGARLQPRHDGEEGSMKRLGILGDIEERVKRIGGLQLEWRKHREWRCEGINDGGGLLFWAGVKDGTDTELACFSNKGPTEVVSVLKGLRSQMESGTRRTCWKMCLHLRFQTGPGTERHCVFIYILVHLSKRQDGSVCKSPAWFGALIFLEGICWGLGGFCSRGDYSQV